jgi:uncharacterized membrane protein YgcG
MLRRLSTLAVLTAAVGVTAPAVARELHWRELDVRARLASDGSLAVSERHAMVFTGDWNGGERIFRLGFGHRLELDGVYRRDAAAGEWRRLERGPLERLDHWNWTDAKTLRWRSRMPGDPPFRQREIGYRLDYRLTGVLERRGETWLLDHDFAFPDRAGPIERFTLVLELAPEWQAARGVPRFTPVRLAPGAGHVVTLELEFRGDGEPAQALPRRLSPAVRAVAIAAAALGALWLVAWAVRRERALGRLLPLPDLAPIDRPWIERRLLTLPPEEVGAAWDEKVAAAEVAALLARLQLEGKLASRIEKKKVLFFETTNLHLHLLVPRGELEGAERALVEGLFPKGDRIDTESLRAHYKTSGFDPAARIRPKLLAGLRRRRELAGTRPRPARWPSVALVLAGAAALVLAMVVSPPDLLAPALLGAALFVSWIPALSGAMALRERVVGFAAPAVAIAIGLGGGLAALALLPFLPQMSVLALGAGVVLFLGLARTAATAMQSRQSAERIARRRELATARAWLARELGRRAPDLADAWVPYLVAFGLAPEMDRWFRAFGSATATIAATAGGDGKGFGGSAASGGWTGGGGAFGGAGASSSWAVAATSIAAGVSAASSGGSGGGGGGGGGSSGGGGGGGW